MNWRAVRAITRKDLKIVRQSRSVVLPMALVPLIIMVGLPAMMAILLSGEAAAADFTKEMGSFLTNLPAGMQAELSGLTNESQRVLYLALVYQFAPLFLILPLMVSSVIGADTFAGEKERKTLEALLYTPTTDGELFVGKTLTAWIPAVLVGLAGAVLYGITANVAAWPVMQHIFFPNLMWLVLVLWVSPAAAGLGLAVMVLVSARVRTFQEAYQLGSMVVLPVVILMLGQMGGLLYFNAELVFVIGLVLWLIDAGLLWYGARSFQRAELIAQL